MKQVDLSALSGHESDKNCVETIIKRRDEIGSFAIVHERNLCPTDQEDVHLTADLAF